MSLVAEPRPMGSAPLVTPPIRPGTPVIFKGVGEAVGHAPLVTPPTMAPPAIDFVGSCGSA
eukprot:10938042-Karenia_brevis.AAC.1